MNHREGFSCFLGSAQIPLDLIKVSKDGEEVWAFAYANLAMVATDKKEASETLPEIREYLNNLLMDQLVAVQGDSDTYFRIAINAFRDFCYGRALAAGWHNKPREDGTCIALMHSELSEALEGVRKDANDDHLPHLKSVDVELGDCVIRICDFAGKKTIDLGGAIIEKMRYNLHREDHKLENREKVGGKAF